MQRPIAITYKALLISSLFISYSIYCDYLVQNSKVKKMYVCEYCKRDYQTENGLKRHVKERHVDLKHYKCIIPLCKAKFIRRAYLLTHLRKVHNFDRATAKHHIRDVQPVKPGPSQIPSTCSNGLSDVSDEELPSLCETRSPYRPQVEQLTDDENNNDLFTAIDSYCQTITDNNPEDTILDNFLANTLFSYEDSIKGIHGADDDVSNMSGANHAQVVSETNNVVDVKSNEKVDVDVCDNGGDCSNDIDNEGCDTNVDWLNYVLGVDVSVIDVSDNYSVDQVDHSSALDDTMNATDDNDIGVNVNEQSDGVNVNDSKKSGEEAVDNSTDGNIVALDKNCDNDKDVDISDSSSDCIFISSDEENEDEETFVSHINLSVSKTEKVCRGNVISVSRTATISYSENINLENIAQNWKDLFHYVYNEFSEYAQGFQSK